MSPLALEPLLKTSISQFNYAENAPETPNPPEIKILHRALTIRNDAARNSISRKVERDRLRPDGLTVHVCYVTG